MAFLAAPRPPVSLETRLMLKATTSWLRIEDNGELYPINGDQLHHEKDRSHFIDSILRKVQAEEDLADKVPRPGQWRLQKDSEDVGLRTMICEHGAVYDVVRQVSSTYSNSAANMAETLITHVLVTSSGKPIVQTRFSEDLIVFLPKSLFVHITVHVYERRKVKKKMKTTLGRELECMASCLVTVRYLLTTAGMCVDDLDPIEVINLVDASAGSVALTQVQLDSPVGMVCQSSQMRFTVTQHW